MNTSHTDGTAPGTVDPHPATPATVSVTEVGAAPSALAAGDSAQPGRWRAAKLITLVTSALLSTTLLAGCSSGSGSHRSPDDVSASGPARHTTAAPPATLPAPSTSHSPVSRPAVAQVRSQGRTQGFNLYNYSAETLVFVSTSGKVSPPPDSAKRIGPGQSVNFEMPHSISAEYSDAHYNAVSADGVVRSTVDVHMGINPPGFVMSTKFDSPNFFTYIAGHANGQFSNTIEDAATSPFATQNYAPGSDAEQAALNNICAAHPDNCTFTPQAGSQKKGFSTRLIAQMYNGNEGADAPDAILATQKSYSATTTNTWNEQISAGLDKVITVGMQASHESSIAFTHDFSTGTSITVKPGFTGYIYLDIPTITTTGTFVAKLGNTTWTMPGVSIISPDPDPNAATSYTTSSAAGEHLRAIALGAHNHSQIVNTTPHNNRHHH